MIIIQPALRKVCGAEVSRCVVSGHVDDDHAALFRGDRWSDMLARVNRWFSSAELHAAARFQDHWDSVATRWLRDQGATAGKGEEGRQYKGYQPSGPPSGTSCHLHSAGLQPQSAQPIPFLRRWYDANRNSESDIQEGLAITLQNVILIALILSERRKTLTGIVLAAGNVIMNYALSDPSLVSWKLLQAFQASTVVIGIASKLPQLWDTHQQKQTGVLSKPSIHTGTVLYYPMSIRHLHS